MKVDRLLGTVVKIEYRKIDSTSAARQKTKDYYYTSMELDCYYDELGENVDQLTYYYANVNLKEVKQGKQKSKKKVDTIRATVYIDEETYDTQSIEVGDILEITNAKVHTFLFKMTVYDKEKLQGYPGYKIHYKYYTPYGCTRFGSRETCKGCHHKSLCKEKDKYIQPYAQIPVNDMRISVSAKDWKTKYKYDEVFVGKIGKFKLSFANKDEMLTFTECECFLDEEEYKTLEKALDGGNVATMKLTAKSNKLCETPVTVTIEFDEELQKHRCTIVAQQ